jgi:hypothetical protein
MMTVIRIKHAMENTTINADRDFRNEIGVSASHRCSFRNFKSEYRPYPTTVPAMLENPVTISTEKTLINAIFTREMSNGAIKNMTRKI